MFRIILYQTMIDPPISDPFYDVRPAESPNSSIASFPACILLRNLDQNPLNELPVEVFRNLTSLTSLNLSGIVIGTRMFACSRGTGI